MRVHRLKTVEPYFTEVKEGRKPFEARKNDRFFQRGDIVELECYVKHDVMIGRIVPNGSEPILRFEIGPILHGPAFGIEAGYCVFGLLPEPELTND